MDRGRELTGMPLTPADAAAQLERVRLESDTLYRIIGVIALSPEVPRILDAVVELLTEATGCHACFVYLREPDGLRLRAATKAYSGSVGQITLPLDDGLVASAVETEQPVFVRERALEDPRFRYVPELNEESFQSMIAVPIPARVGDPIGAISLNTEAPHEFDPETVTFLVHTASLLAGAIETAQLYEEANSRVEALTTLSRISESIAAADRREELFQIAADGARELLRCEACHLYEVDAGTGELELVAASPTGAPAPPEVAGRGEGSGDLPREIVAEVASGGERLGELRATGPESRRHPELLGAIANQTAVALKRAELIERLTEENLVRDLFEALTAQRLEVATARARSVRCQLDREHVILRIEPAASAPETWADTIGLVEPALRRLAPTVVVDVQPDAVQAIVPPRVRSATGGLDQPLRELARERRLIIGQSRVLRSAEESIQGMHEARDAARAGQALSSEGTLWPHQELGAYSYLLHLDSDAVPKDSYRAAIRHLMEYDARHSAHLLETLERYLGKRGAIRTTAVALHVHPNTVRQRLERIAEITDLDLGQTDLLALEVVVKLARLGRL
jgi:GAF domain-containing protein